MACVTSNHAVNLNHAVFDAKAKVCDRHGRRVSGCKLVSGAAAVAASGAADSATDATCVSNAATAASTSSDPATDAVASDARELGRDQMHVEPRQAEADADQ